jgi:hypothetical protein
MLCCVGVLVGESVGFGVVFAGVGLGVSLGLVVGVVVDVGEVVGCRVVAVGEADTRAGRPGPGLFFDAATC